KKTDTPGGGRVPGKIAESVVSLQRLLTFIPFNCGWIRQARSFHGVLESRPVDEATVNGITKPG
ncbi:hypothetical protein, partial [Pseudomonas savastanoi]|uniref:hypothetical protein n=1 Tax=Pseudomonas savastanoi TaxID=29438 RepID=UPI001EE77F22